MKQPVSENSPHKALNFSCKTGLMSDLIKILLAEQHTPLRDVISAELNGMEDVSLQHTVASGEELEQYLRLGGELPDVVLLDANLDMDAEFHYSRMISDTFPGITLLALADRDESLYIRKMIGNGANGHVHRESCIEGLGKLLAESELCTEPHIQFNYCSGKNGNPKPAQEAGLDPAERKVLKLLMNQYSSLEISEELSMDTKTIHETIERLKIKTNSTNPLQLKRFAVRHAIC
jgi:DNA-binding NarL/FixJ family response regulator